MSGPKVVRITTKEEIMATCKGHLVRLDQAIKQWQKSMAKLEETDEKYYETILATRKNFDHMFEEELFSEIPKQVLVAISNLDNDIAKRRQLKIAAKIQHAIEVKQAKENIKALVNLLNHKQIALSDEFNNELQIAIKGKYQGNINQLLTKAFSLLKPNNTTELSQQQQALLSRMVEDNTTQTFASWLEKQHIELQKDPYIQKIEHYLAELSFEQKEIYGVFIERLNAIEQQPVDSRQKLLLDSIVLDLAQAVKEAKERDALQTQLELLIAELNQKTIEPLNFDLNTLDTININQLKKLIDSCEQTLAQITEKTVATYRQQAILQGLASLGYEVRHGMDTKWVKDGRLVLRNPSTPGYGIELAGKAEAARMQIRAVKLTGENNQQRDNDIEILWCGDFHKLQQWLAKQGSYLTIEKALPVGTVALKSVTTAESDALEGTTTQTTLTSTKR